MRDGVMNQKEFKEYMKDWQPGIDFLTSLGYRVFCWDPDYGIVTTENRSYSIPREFIERLIRRFGKAPSAPASDGKKKGT
jgi:hypothetical protein